MNNTEQKIYEKLAEDSKKTFPDFLENNAENKYTQSLIEEIVSDNFDLKKVIEYGLSQISKSKEICKSLSSYFFLLSELKDINAETRDFVLDVSIWCEGADEYSQYFKTFAPLQIYKKKIEPFL